MTGTVPQVLRRLLQLSLLLAWLGYWERGYVAGSRPSSSRRSRRPSSLRELRVSREEMLLSGEGTKLIEALPAVRQEDMLQNTSIALAGIALFGYMSYQFWTRIAFGKAFGWAPGLTTPVQQWVTSPW